MLLLRALLALLLSTGAAFAQNEDEGTADRFVIPPEAMSPLRRDETAAMRQARPQQVDTIPDVIRDVAALPAPVRATRERILTAAKAGDIRALRSLIGTGDQATQLSFDEMETDPIDFLLAASGDPEGHEVLAILTEVLEAGYVRVEDEDGVLYIWPYFAAYPVDRLTPSMRVELFRLLTGGDYDEMREFGAYIFYRTGISEDGRWQFFLSGDG